ncbi:MAG: RsmB/NOP family class I SAM-dependent RNA methyltransferase [Myxococcales bacterium]|jgi:16S rRNA (cytosine967-C5)-methyltransferase
MRAEGDLGPQERLAAAHAARSVLRELRRIDLALRLASEAAGMKQKSIAAHDRSLLRYLALRVAIEGEDAKRSLTELALPGPRRPRAIDGATLARIAAHLPAVDFLPVPPDPVAALAQRRSVPDFLARLFVEDLGLERADSLLAALNQPHRLDLRANRLLATRDEVASALAADGASVAPCALARDGLTAADRAGLFGRAHDRGLFEVQDEGSQLIAELCGAAPGETVVDFCAGSGGKSLALAAAVGTSGRVFACDADARRLSELPARARRARAAAIVEAAGAEPPESLAGKADAVLVDAPCSGLGSLRREPDLRWRLSEARIGELPALQLEILRRAARFVRPGGRLVYATCSPLRLEDEKVVESFLALEPGFALAPLASTLDEQVARQIDEGGFMRVWPDRHGGGAFFAALLIRSQA